MNDWFEVFRAGTWTDSKGRTRTWTEADLDRIAAGYDPADHEAPLVIGHPQANAPAYGWVEGLKREGSRLLAKARQVVPEFAAAVAQGLYKKRSISLASDGVRLRHVGFLGAAEPAVPGLKDLAFAGDDEEQRFEFAAEDPPAPSQEDANHSEEERMTIEQLQAQLAAEKAAREAAEARAAATAAEFSAAQSKARRQELDAWFDALVRDGKALPAWKTQGMGVVEFAAQIDEAGEYEFAAPDGSTQKQSPGAWFRGFVESVGAHPLFQKAKNDGGQKSGPDAQFAADEAAAKQILSHLPQAKA